MKRTLAALALLGAAILPAQAEEVGKVGVDWFGNDIVIDAVSDPKVQGVTCHLASFSRGMIDRLQKGNWFEDPSNASISCQQTGPITIDDIKLGEGGERVFSERTSLIWKKLIITRIYDKREQLAHLSCPCKPGSGWVRQDIDLDDPALCRQRDLDKGQAGIVLSTGQRYRRFVRRYLHTICQDHFDYS